MEAKDTEFVRISFFQEILRCLGRIDKIRIKDVEFVALDGLGRRIVVVVMSLVVLVPIIPSLDTVKVSWPSWSILV